MANSVAKATATPARFISGSDTVASEIGKAWGRRTWLVPTLRRVPPGTSGAISAQGTAAGLLGAFPIVIFALLVQRHLVRGLTLGALK